MLKPLLSILAVVLVHADKNELLTCNFEVDTCGFRNQEGMLGTWKRMKTEIAERKGLMMVAESNSSGKQKARLLSPFFELQATLPACLHFEAFLSGEGVSGLRVEQTDDLGSRVLVGIHTQVPVWRKYDVDVLIEDYLRFVFEAEINPEIGETTVAIDNFMFTLGKCRLK